jgi:hypothetical protein
VYCIDDKPNGIIINHSSSWSVEVRLAWYIPSERRGPDPGPAPPSLRECECLGVDLVAGHFTLLKGDEPPVNVITRAVALAVEAYLRGKMMRALDNDVYIDRGKL